MPQPDLKDVQFSWFNASSRKYHLGGWSERDQYGMPVTDASFVTNCLFHPVGAKWHLVPTSWAKEYGSPCGLCWPGESLGKRSER